MATPMLENDQLEDVLTEALTPEEADYGSFSKADFQKLFEKHTKEADVADEFYFLKKLKPYTDQLHEAEKNAALDKFLANGGESDDFDFRPDAFYEKIEAAYQKAKNNYSQLQKEAQLKKETNLKSKNEILAQMRQLIESGSVSKNTFENFKKLQQDWKNTGQVAADKANELWSSYHALINRFYDQRSIAFELLDLDRKRNLQAKLVICEKVEKLADEPSIKKALKELEELHEEFRHIGPVPKEQQEEIWNRLKEASNKIHEKKKDFIDELKGKYDVNLSLKLAIIEKINVLAEFRSEKPEEWAVKTKELDAIQEEWKNAGLIDKEKVKEVNKQYWDGLKKFFNAKRSFFKELEKVKTENLRLKTALCEKAESLASNIDWEKTTQEIIDLQKQWKSIGHVPLKLKDKIYERFKKACDVYFDAKRANLNQSRNTSKQFLKEKIDFLEELDKLQPNSSEDIHTKINEWYALPGAEGVDTTKVNNQFIEIVKSKLRQVSDLDEIGKDMLVSRLMVHALRSTPDGEKELINKERKLRKELRDIEDNIAQFKNNMEFFARSKNAESIKKEFLQKILDEENKFKLTKARLNVLLGK